MCFLFSQKTRKNCHTCGVFMVRWAFQKTDIVNHAISAKNTENNMLWMWCDNEIRITEFPVKDYTQCKPCWGVFYFCLVFTTSMQVEKHLCLCWVPQSCTSVCNIIVKCKITQINFLFITITKSILIDIVVSRYVNMGGWLLFASRKWEKRNQKGFWW